MFDNYTETGKAVDGSYKQQDTTLEDYTLTETGASSITVDGIATGSIQEQASNVQEGTLSITSESTETDAVITTGGTSIDNVSATTTETMNTLTGTTSVSAAASDRYSLLTDYNNPASSGSPSTAVISEVGLPIVAVSASGASGTAISNAGGGSAANLSGNPSNSYSDAAGRASQLRAGATIVMPAEGAMGGAAAMSQAADLGAELYKQYCFAAETPIRTPTGSKLIKDIVPGDWVLASPEDKANGPIEAKIVEEVFVNETHLWSLYVQGEKIRTAGEHRFYVLGKGWVKAAGMREGDLLRSDDGQWMAVEGVEETGDYETVYNFRVADWHTYFVGAIHWGFSVWAHNSYEGWLSSFGLNKVNLTGEQNKTLESFYKDFVSGDRQRASVSDYWQAFKRQAAPTINEARGAMNLEPKTVKTNGGLYDMANQAWNDDITPDREARRTAGIPIEGGPVIVNGKEMTLPEMLDDVIQRGIESTKSGGSLENNFGVEPMKGSGGRGEVYLMHPGSLQAALNEDGSLNGDFVGYFGVSKQEGGAASRMLDADHLAKTVNGEPPDCTVLAKGLTDDEMFGIEALLIQRGQETFGNDNLGNIVSGHHIDEPDHPVIQAGAAVIATNYRLLND